MLKLKDIMQVNVMAVPPDYTLRELLEALAERRVSGAPVVAGGKVLGVVSVTDILEFQETTPRSRVRREDAGDDVESITAVGEETSSPPSEYFAEMWEPARIDTVERMRTADEPEWDVLDEYTVGDVMTREIVSQSGDTSLREAASYMLAAGVHRLLVIDDGRFRGIVSMTDIVRAVADGKLKG